MTSNDKLKFFDPSDVDAAQSLAWAALRLAESALIACDINPRGSEDMSLCVQAVGRALNLPFHEKKETLETAPEVIRRILCQGERDTP